MFNFNNLQPIGLSQDTIEQSGSFSNLKELRVGTGESFWVRNGKMTIGTGTNLVGSQAGVGNWWGAEDFNSAPARIGVDGSAVFNSILINGRSGQALANAINSDANLITQVINSKINTSSQQILAGFDFGTTDYAGAVKTGDITWNVTTGAITGGSGVVVYKGGIVGASSGVAKFYIDTSGNAYFAGTLAGASGTFGTITAGTFTGGTFTGVTITGSLVRTASSGARIQMNNSTNKIEFLNSSAVVKGEFYISSNDIVMNSADDFIFQINGVSKVGVFGDYFRPTTTNNYTLGKSDYYWLEAFIKKVSLPTWTIEEDTSNRIVIKYSGTTLFRIDNSDGDLHIKTGGSFIADL